MVQRYPTFFPSRLSNRVNNMAYDARSSRGHFRAVFGVLNTADATNILSAQSISGTGSTTTFAAAYTTTDANLGPWGRALTAVASTGGVASKIYVRGRDYLNQKVYRQITLNGTTVVNDTVALKAVDQVDWDNGGSGITLNLGHINVFGLPYKLLASIVEIKDGAVAANAATIAAALGNTLTATATSADVRGTYAPATTLPNGAHTFELDYVPDDANLHGVGQFFQ